MTNVSNTDVFSLIFGYEDWANEELKLGRQVFYMNFMFNPIPGATDRMLSTMHRAIERDFYDELCRRTCRRPTAVGAKPYLPKLIAFPDRPAWKRGAHLAPHVTVNDGFHFNGFLSVSRQRRFPETVKKHIRANAHIYQGRQLSRVHVVRPIGNIGHLADYSIKSVKRKTDLSDYILILPRASSEREPQRAMSDTDRGIKEIQSRLNVSEEIAQAILRNNRARTA